jgi:lipopolysaccharide/colanic/teichoic acid biosynthesis glycosyltransferase
MTRSTGSVSSRRRCAKPKYLHLPRVFVKSATDYFLAATLLLLLSPLFVAVAAAIKATDGGPVFFRQTRIGRHGQPFRIWKFRSMTTGADKLLNEVKAQAGQVANTFYKSAHDPRVTAIGRVIRKLSIDELPQLLNVLGGKMSLIGPRPLAPGEGAEVADFLVKRHVVKPGLTGLWQVSGRSAVDEDARVRLDLRYVETWSLRADLIILARTFRTVLSAQGAY